LVCVLRIGRGMGKRSHALRILQGSSGRCVLDVTVLCKNLDKQRKPRDSGLTARG